MKRKTLMLLLAGWILTQRAWSQDYSTTLGQISKNEIDMEYSDLDEDAVAVKLFDIGDIAFRTDHKGHAYIIFSRKMRMKILEDAGKSFANLDIPYYIENDRRKERVVSIVGTAYNFEQGKLESTSLEKDQIFDEKINQNWRQKKLAIPNVRTGTIVEISYEIESPFFFNMPTWRFQAKIPTEYSELSLHMIPKYDFQFIAQGISKFDYENVDKRGRDEVVSTYAMKDVPAFGDESYITSISDYVQKLGFQLSRVKYDSGDIKDYSNTWESLIDLYMDSDNYGKYLKKAKKISEKILEQAKSQGKISANPSQADIVNFCRDYFLWNSRYSDFTSESAKKVYESKTGNSSEINLFLVAMLRSQGYEADPLLISTRKHGKIFMGYPFTKFFNHSVVIFKENGGMFITDGMADHLPYNRCLPNVFNDLGLVMKKGEPQWIDLRSNIPSNETFKTQLTLDLESDVIKDMTIISSDEYEAHEWRSAFSDDEDKLMEYLDRFDHGEINAVQTRNYDDPNKPYLVVVNAERELERIGNDILIQPFAAHQISENRLVADSRTYPVDLVYPSNTSFQCNVALPEGYALVNEHKDISVSDDLVDIAYTLSSSPMGVSITGHYFFKQSVVQPSNYQLMKDHFDLIVDTFGEEILLRKE